MANNRLHILLYFFLLIGISTELSFAQTHTASGNATVTVTVVPSQGAEIKKINTGDYQISVQSVGTFQIVVANANSISRSFFCTKEQPVILPSSKQKLIAVQCQNLSL